MAASATRFGYRPRILSPSKYKEARYGIIYWFRQAAWILFCLMGIVVVISLLSIFPFDFSVIPNATAADVVPKVVAVFLILMAAFYGICALVLFVKLRRYMVKQGTR
jgi:hypothetical protein